MPTTFPPGTLSGSGVGTTPDPSPIPSGRLHFYVNTTPFTLDHPAPELTVLQFLRQEGFTGTKLGCAEGGCGACTVVVAAWHATAGKVTHHSANGCLLPLCTLDGKQVITVEGIGTAKAPHPVQERLALMHGSQCGFCTPGIAMSLYSLLRNNPTPTVHDVEGTFDGNLCRCTGYRPILDAAKTFVVPQVTPDLGEAAGHACPGAHGCGRTSCSADERSACAAGDQAKLADIEDLHPIDTTAGLKFRPYDPSQDLAFPTALVDYVRSGGSATGNEGDSVAQGGRPPHVFRGEVCEAFHRPVTLTHLLQLKRDHPDCKLLAGNTEVGIETKFKSQPYPIRVYVGDIPELQTVKILEDGVAFGASITLTHFRNELQDLMASQSTERTEGFKALLTSLRWLAGNQIRNVATLAGNVVSAAPTSDLNPVLLACGAILTLQAHGSMLRQVPITEFLTRNGPPALGRHEVVTTIHIPFSRPGQYIRSYKQSKRKTDGKAIVNAGLLLDLESHEAATAQESGSDWVIRRCQLAFGGVGSTTVQAIATASTMVGRTMHDPTTFQDLLAAAKGELQLDIDCPGGMAEYRLSLVTGFLFKFWHEVCCALGIAGLTVDQATLTQEIPREPSSGLQFYAAVQDTSEVSQPRPHLSGLTHTTGETHYTDDIPPVTRELYGAPVLAGPARAKILRIDPAPALALPGVIRFFGHGDVPGTNLLGPIAQDECLFAENEVNFSGQILGLIVAKDRGTAQRAAKLVRVEYEYLTPILTIDEAIAQKSFYGGDRVVESGDVESGFTEADHIFEGEYRVGGQEHFYLETQAGRVVPLGEGDEVEVFASTQNPSFVQRGVASVLGIPRNRVTCRVKRLGGGFGGKEMRPTFLAGALAVAAYHLNRPVRCMMERDEDMITSGQRHPFLGRWKAGFTVDGKFTTLALELYSNAGHSLDTSLMVVENAMLHADNVYHIPHMRVRGHACRTNVHSNTSMRGFGTPQCIFIIESLLDECADRLGLPAHVVRERNFKVEGQTAYFGSALHDWHLKKTWDAALRTSDFTTRRREIDQFNQTSHWKKRGLAVMASRNTVGYPDKFLNQAGALVQIYTDGTVLVSHGGTEMGQGLHTKMAQICAEELDIPLSSIYISETSTDKVPNTTSTSASSGSELNGMAVLDACRQLSARLQPFRERMPEATFKDLIMAAYYDRVSLSASGFHKVPNVSYDFATQKGIPAFYFTTGTAVCEVELDVLTGDHVVRRTDIVMEIARSLNPAIDIGQIEGGFVQGMGWCTTEETLFNPDGALLTRGPNTYNIPTARDVPRDFRVHILPNLSYQKLQAVHGSKAVGEHPVSLANSVPLALRDAVKAARADPHLRMAPGMLSENTHEADPPASTLGDSVILHAPATAEQLRMLCQDTIARTCTIPQELKEDRIPAVVRISGQSCSAA
ncbi:hypothetical protein IWQ60_007308 [Tieghemiomyces parasiticus]|uniref:xanthine dehydrogenase n=1 Tax=Tieghemiomyces parasiticus TaxID=78921 RepID=A0A9W7ZY55_9FUNG|nr:hypothetical protein IWQ60_007308 [Tieghemiomyces parasiticus]